MAFFCRFIRQEAEEKAAEIGVSAEEEFNITKLQVGAGAAAGDGGASWAPRLDLSLPASSLSRRQHTPIPLFTPSLAGSCWRRRRHASRRSTSGGRGPSRSRRRWSSASS
jgi:hypothetical protein